MRTFWSPASLPVAIIGLTTSLLVTSAPKRPAAGRHLPKLGIACQGVEMGG